MYEEDEVKADVGEGSNIAEETPVETPEVRAEPKERTVPLNKFLTEKERRKALEREIAELKRTSNTDETKNLIEKYKRAGFDDEAAAMIAEDFARLAVVKKSSKDEIAEEIDDLILESEFYDDAKSFEKEIREEIARTGCDVKTAYIRRRDPTDRAREIANRGKATPAALKAQPTSKPATPSGNALSEAEREQLKALQEMFHTQKWDADSYRKYMRNK